jgi:hypothetical protein
MNQVEHRGRSGDPVQSQFVPAGGSLQIECLDGHGMDVPGWQLGMFEEALTQMGEIPLRISGGRHTLVHLKHVDSIPWHLFGSQRAQHHPGSIAATYGHDEAAPLRNGQPSLLRDHTRSFFGDQFRVRKHFDVQHTLTCALL